MRQKARTAERAQTRPFLCPLPPLTLARQVLHDVES